MTGTGATHRSMREGSAVLIMAIARVLLLIVAAAAPLSAASLTGKVADKAGKPIFGASITLYSEERDWHTSSVGGQFRLDGVPDGTYVLEVARTGFQRRTWEDLRLSSTLATVDVVMDVCDNLCSPECEPRAISYENAVPEVTLRGVVIAEDRGPLAGAPISIRASTGEDAIATVTSDGRGEFKFRSLSPGKYVVSSGPKGYWPTVLADVRVMSRRTAVIELSVVPRWRNRVCQ